ncbi:facilitated trehalose transporter Tret1-like [Epargyreus clarus]|uniref:facilitated trehalose transporter Tret1-like n=1 Tax=Epargyreus clarus TaxID=520877 RepID=UPI003C2CEC6F
MVTPFLKQAWTVSGVLYNMLGQGMLLSFTTCLLPALRDPSSPIQADLDTASMLASSVGLAGIPGFLISSILMDWIGRKLAHAFVLVPGIIGWLLVYFATNIPALMIGRLLGGMAAGATVCLGAVVIGEYTSPKSRGMFLNLKTAAVCLGGMVVHILGNYYTWRTVALIAVIPHIASLIVICTWPESPAWLASRKQFEKSEKAFYWLRGRDKESIAELEELIKAQKERTMDIDPEKTIGEKIVDFLKKFTKKDFIKPTFIIILGAFVLETSGRHIFPAYALQIIGEITGDKSQSFYYTLAIDLIITLSATFSSVLVKLLKRRTLLFSTGFAAAFVLFIVCTYLFLASKQIISNDRVWIPIFLFVIYFILANLGCTPIPLALLGEVFPLEHRGAGSAVGGFFLSVGVMVGLQVTPYLMENIKVYGTFAVLGGTMSLSLLCLYFILPETKDRTLQEIEDFFNDGKFKEKKTQNDDEEVKMKMLS